MQAAEYHKLVLFLNNQELVVCLMEVKSQTLAQADKLSEPTKQRLGSTQSSCHLTQFSSPVLEKKDELPLQKTLFQLCRLQVVTKITNGFISSVCM